jgi:hypothetical protein
MFWMLLFWIVYCFDLEPEFTGSSRVVAHGMITEPPPLHGAAELRVRANGASAARATRGSSDRAPDGSIRDANLAAASEVYVCDGFATQPASERASSAATGFGDRIESRPSLELGLLEGGDLVC